MTELSLNFAVFADFLRTDETATRWTRALRWVLLKADRLFQVERLHSFNRKFFPHWRRRYFCFERWTRLPARRPRLPARRVAADAARARGSSRPPTWPRDEKRSGRSRSSPSRSSSSPARRRARRALHLVRVAHFSAPVYADVGAGRARQPLRRRAGRADPRARERADPARRRSSTSARRCEAAASRGCCRSRSRPDYAQNRLFYVDYTDSNGDTRVVEYRSNGTRRSASSAKQLLFVKDFASNHNGGQLAVRPGRRLYWGNGDGGGGGDPQTTARASRGRSRRSCA